MSKLLFFLRANIPRATGAIFFATEAKIIRCPTTNARQDPRRHRPAQPFPGVATRASHKLLSLPQHELSLARHDLQTKWYHTEGALVWILDLSHSGGLGWVRRTRATSEPQEIKKAQSRRWARVVHAFQAEPANVGHCLEICWAGRRNNGARAEDVAGGCGLRWLTANLFSLCNPFFYLLCFLAAYPSLRLLLPQDNERPPVLIEYHRHGACRVCAPHRTRTRQKKSCVGAVGCVAKSHGFATPLWY